MKPFTKKMRNTTMRRTIKMHTLPIKILIANGNFFFEELAVYPGWFKSFSLLCFFALTGCSSLGEVVLPNSSHEILYFLQ